MNRFFKDFTGALSSAKIAQVVNIASGDISEKMFLEAFDPCSGLARRLRNRKEAKAAGDYRTYRKPIRSWSENIFLERADAIVTHLDADSESALEINARTPRASPARLRAKGAQGEQQRASSRRRRFTASVIGTFPGFSRDRN